MDEEAVALLREIKDLLVVLSRALLDQPESIGAATPSLGIVTIQGLDPNGTPKVVSVDATGKVRTTTS